MTIAEKLRNEGKVKWHKEGKQEGLFEGKQEGLKEGIEIVLSYKFPEDIDMMMALVHKIESLDTLNKVNEALKTKQDKAEVLALLK